MESGKYSCGSRFSFKNMIAATEFSTLIDTTFDHHHHPIKEKRVQIGGGVESGNILAASRRRHVFSKSTAGEVPRKKEKTRILKHLPDQSCFVFGEVECWSGRCNPCLNRAFFGRIFSSSTLISCQRICSVIWKVG